MLGFAFNLLFTTASDKVTTLRLIQGAPLVPALLLFTMTVFFCPESPRYHLQKGPNYNPEKAYKILLQLRNTEVRFGYLYIYIYIYIYYPIYMY